MPSAAARRRLGRWCRTLLAATNRSVLVLGIDPGTRYLGWGLVRRAGTRLEPVGHGVIRAQQPQLAERLVSLESELSQVVNRYRPDCGAVESLFFYKDAQAAAKLGHARGVALLVLARAGLEVFEYAPAKIKRVIAGSGGAEKRQVSLVVRALLSLSTVPPADASDALAVALTHLRVGRLAGVSIVAPPEDG